MAWYHQYQFAEVVDPLYRNLRSKCLPICRYEIADNPKKILRVQVCLSLGNYRWFNSDQIILYKSGKDLIGLPDQKHSKSILSRVFKFLNLKEF